MTDWSEFRMKPSDWFLDGHRITKANMHIWDGLDWSKAWPDLGNSPAGNPGPCLHVPYPARDTMHRLYPKLPDKWAPFIYVACEEASSPWRIAAAGSAEIKAENASLKAAIARLLVQRAEDAGKLAALMKRAQDAERALADTRKLLA